MQVVFDETADQLGHACAVIAIGDKIDPVFERLNRVRNGDGTLAATQEGMVIFGIADADDVVAGEFQFGEGAIESCHLVDAGGQHHDGAFVEDDLQFEPELTDAFENRDLVRMPGSDDYVADAEARDAAPLEIGDEFIGRALRQRAFFARGWIEEKGAIFGNDAIEEIEVGEDAFEIGQFPACDHDQLAPGLTEIPQSFKGGFVDSAIVSESAVVVCSQCEISHKGAPRQRCICVTNGRSAKENTGCGLVA